MAEPATIFLSAPDVGSLERESLMAAFDSGWIAPAGPALVDFERKASRALGDSHQTVALSSGTAALHLALLDYEVGAGEDVLVSSLTFAASAFPVTYVGARPCFIDSEHSSWNMDPDLLEMELRSRAKRGRLPGAVIPVDLYGQCADYERIEPLCAEFEVPLIVDAAEAVGASRFGRMAGTFGDCAALSFNGNKILTTGGGGMLVSADSDFIERARFLSTQAREPVAHYEHTAIGYNYRMSNLLAAIGSAQLARLPEIIAHRIAINERYRSELGGRFGIEFQPVPIGSDPNNWLTVGLLPVGGRAPEHVCKVLASQNIEARPAWKPMHQQPVFADNPVVGGGVADDIFARGICFPSGSSMSEDDLDRVVASCIIALS